MTRPAKLFRLLLVMAMLLPLISCAALHKKYSANPIEAWVVDAETKQPLEGVIVVAHWELTGGIHQQTVGQLMVMETVTDQAGRFAFPAWGPKKTPTNVPFPGTAYLTTGDPVFRLFKSGYQNNVLRNALTTDALKGLGPSLRSSDWDKKTIKMEKFNGPMEEYVNYFVSFNYDLERIVTDNPKTCDWKKIPIAIHAMSLERKRLEELRIKPHRLSAIDTGLIASNDYLIKAGGCGSPKEFFGEFQQ